MIFDNQPSGRESGRTWYVATVQIDRLTYKDTEVATGGCANDTQPAELPMTDCTNAKSDGTPTANRFHGPGHV